MENFDFHTIAPAATSLEPNVALCPTPVKASIPAASLSAAEYLDADAHMVYVEQAEKAGDVSNLTALLKDTLSSNAPYSSKRDVIIPVSLALNHLKKIAPRFRGFPAAVFGGGSPSDQQLSLDKQFIDLHWLKCKMHKKPVSDKRLRIPRHPATQSALIWPGIPRPSGHLFHGHPAGQSERSDAGVALLV